LTHEDLHDVVDIDKIEPKAVHSVVEWDEAAAVRGDSPKQCKVTYDLPIAVSKTWRAMFQKPDPTRSGATHQVSFEFSDDGREVAATVKGDPSPELLLVLKTYATHANKRWAPYKEKVLGNRAEEQRILESLKESK